MSRGDRDGEEGADEFIEVLRDFFTAYKNDIGTVIRAVARNIEQGTRMRLIGMLYTFALLGVIILVLTFLSLQHIVSGDAMAFLIGSIVGYLFSFLRRYVVGGVT